MFFISSSDTLLILLFIVLSYTMAQEYNLDKCRKTDDSIEDTLTCKQNVQVSSSSALAVIPYTEEGRLPHMLSSRDFHLAGQNLHIDQDWHSHGVAAVVWDAAVVLGEYLEKHPELVAEKNVIELGAGTGVAGMAAALLGGHVTVTEREKAMGHLEKTVKSNMADLTNISFMDLDWTQHSTRSLHSYDVVLGADIVYIEDTFQDLLETILKLTGDQTLVLLSCRIRYKRDTNFLDLLSSHLHVRQIFYDVSRDIRIYSASRSSAEEL